MPWHGPRAPIELSLAPWLRVLVPFLIFVTAFGIYQYKVEHPPIIIFDEAHYVKVGRNFTRGVFIDPAWGAGDPRPQNFEHPPMGKYMIAAGIWLNGRPHNEMENQAYITTLCGHDNPECANDAKGWRLGSTVAGASGLVAVYLLAMRLFNRVSAGAVAALLLFLDGMYFMHARLALLDIFPTVFWLWSFAFTLSPYRGGRWLGAVFFGFALASKYYVLFLLPMFLLLQFLRTKPVSGRHVEEGPIEAAAERVRSAWDSARPWVYRLGFTVLLGLVLPILTFTATHAPFFWDWYKHHGVLFAIKEFLFVEGAAFTWDYGSNATHPFESPWWSWIPMIKPVYYYVGSPGTELEFAL